MRKILVLLFLFTASGNTISDDTGYSLEEATEFRNEWTADNWDEGGALMRYVFLNMPEFGATLSLAVAARHEICR